MKHQSLSKSTKSNIHEPKLDNDGRKRLASKSKQPPCEPHRKPLSGRIFYLDLPCNKRSQTLESDIKFLGGTVEKFFSKEIRYLVSSKPEARHVQRLIQDSPVPSPDSGLSSPHPASKRDSTGHRGSSQGAADTVVVSRGKSLVEKVVKEQDRFQINRILANALEWGVKILYIDDIISYIDKKKSQLPKVRTVAPTVKAAAKPDPTKRTAFQKSSAGRISRPFVKVEDSSRHYRPIYLPMANMPVFNFKSAVPCSPFLMEDNDNDAKTKNHKAHCSAGDRETQARKERRKGHEGKGRRKGGYCECCLVKYDKLRAHLQSERHQAFSKSEEYSVVDRVIAGLTCELTDLSTPKRVKCSVSSPVLAPGAVMKKEHEEKVLEAEKGKTSGFPFWSSHNTDFSSGTPQPVRKRCRQFSQSPEEGAVEQSDALEKSQSKRGPYEWGSSSHTPVHKTLGASLPSTKKGCFSDSLERNRRSFTINLKQRPALQHVRSLQSIPSGHKPENVDVRTTWEPIKDSVASEPSGISRLNFHTAKNSLLETTSMQVFNRTPPHNLSNTPVKTEHPSDANHGSVAAERSLSSRGHEPDNTDSPSRTLRRKVRISETRRRRKVSTEALHGLSSKGVESQTPQTFCKVSDSHSLSASAMDLWQLFMSSDDMEDDFKGFCD